MHMSELLQSTESLIQQIGRLNAEAARRRVKARALRDERDGAASERDRLKVELEQSQRERDELSAKLTAEPGEHLREIERLKGELRTRDHRETFKRIAAEAQAAPGAIEDLWTLSGYRAEGDQPDEVRIRELVEGAKASRPYLFQGKPAEAGKTEGPPAAPVRPPGPGLSRGVPDATSGGVAVRQAQLRDPNWMRLNQGSIAEASKKGLLTILPD